MTGYWEYVKERWKDAFDQFIAFLPIMGLFGWFIPFISGIIMIGIPSFTNTLAIYLTIIGATWGGCTLAYMVVQWEKDSYADWKELYAVNHREKPSDSDKELEKP